jgi:hypothetical protein
MFRLNHRAYEILRAEVCHCTENDVLQQTQRDIVLKRLERLRAAKGLPATLEELQETVGDFFPKFSDRVLKSAAKANRGSGVLTKVPWVVGAAGTAIACSGIVWVLNLPYPMIRFPVARTAPILLLPSYISMDYHYRQAVAQVEQADQLINNATSPADISLGETKVKEAQQHLDALPVWFLGYAPQFSFWFGWRFTFDEFQSARASVGRMGAKVFQQQNAQVQLEQAETALSTAKQQYQKATTEAEKATAIASWQAAIDQLEQVPTKTLAGQTAHAKMAAMRRDFQQVVGSNAGGARTSTLIAAAQQFATAAERAAQNPPHVVTEWEGIADLWEQAIARLQQVEADDPGYVEAQSSLASYKINLTAVRTQLQAERESVEALSRAKQRIPALLADRSTDNRDRLRSQMQEIINQLENVKSGTTAYAEAQFLLKSAENKQKQLQR